MNQEYCFRCEAPFSEGDEKYQLESGWNVPSDDYECEDCAQARFDAYMESRVF